MAIIYVHDAVFIKFNYGQEITHIFETRIMKKSFLI